MAPILLIALALLAQDAPAAPPSSGEDGPVATAAPRKQDVAPLPIQGGPVTPPTDDYGFVGWCFGAVSGYVDLYDKAMPEVIRIERAWPTPGTEENIAEVYPAQRTDAIASLELFRRAIVAAEKASPTPIAQQGAAAIKKGRGVWTGSSSVPKAQLAQFWMSWSPPARCEEVAKALEARSILFGQALTYNAQTADTAAPAEDPEAATEAETPASEPADTESADAAEVGADAAPVVSPKEASAPPAEEPAAEEPVAADAVEEPTEPVIDPPAVESETETKAAVVEEDAAPAEETSAIDDLIAAPPAAPDADEALSAEPMSADEAPEAPAEADAEAMPEPDVEPEPEPEPEPEAMPTALRGPQ